MSYVCITQSPRAAAAGGARVGSAGPAHQSLLDSYMYVSYSCMYVCMCIIVGSAGAAHQSRGATYMSHMYNTKPQALNRKP